MFDVLWIRSAPYYSEIEDLLGHQPFWAIQHSESRSVGRGADVSLHLEPDMCWWVWLHRWWQFPEVGVTAQVQLLMVFQQLVELQESTRILVDLGSQPRAEPHYGELKVAPSAQRRDRLRHHSPRLALSVRAVLVLLLVLFSSTGPHLPHAHAACSYPASKHEPVGPARSTSKS